MRPAPGLNEAQMKAFLAKSEAFYNRPRPKGPAPSGGGFFDKVSSFMKNNPNMGSPNNPIGPKKPMGPRRPDPPNKISDPMPPRPPVVKNPKLDPRVAMKHGGMAHGKAPKGRGLAVMIAIGKPKGRGK